MCLAREAPRSAATGGAVQRRCPPGMLVLLRRGVAGRTAPTWRWTACVTPQSLSCRGRAAAPAHAASARRCPRGAPTDTRRRAPRRSARAASTEPPRAQTARACPKSAGTRSVRAASAVRAQPRGRACAAARARGAHGRCDRRIQRLAAAAGCTRAPPRATPPPRQRRERAMRADDEFRSETVRCVENRVERGVRGLERSWEQVQVEHAEGRAGAAALCLVQHHLPHAPVPDLALARDYRRQDEPERLLKHERQAAHALGELQ
eukprot:5267101-Pleurochrysis_carterae.AAC.2